MRRFRILPSTLLSLLLVAPEAISDKQPPPSAMQGVHVRVLRSDKLTQFHNGQPAKASMIEVTLDPQAASMPHYHPGPVSGYVLEGTLEFAVADQPVQTLRPGDTFFEPAMILHRVAANPNKHKKTRFVVTMIHPASAKRLTIPAKDVTLDTTPALPGTK